MVDVKSIRHDGLDSHFLTMTAFSVILTVTVFEASSFFSLTFFFISLHLDGLPSSTLYQLPLSACTVESFPTLELSFQVVCGLPE